MSEASGTWRPSGPDGGGASPTGRCSACEGEVGGGQGEAGPCATGSGEVAGRWGLGTAGMTGRQLLAVRRELLGWLVLEEVEVGAGSGPREVISSSWLEGGAVVQDIKLGEAGSCGLVESSSVIWGADLVKTCWKLRRSSQATCV